MTSSVRTQSAALLALSVHWPMLSALMGGTSALRAAGEGVDDANLAFAEAGRMRQVAAAVGIVEEHEEADVRLRPGDPVVSGGPPAHLQAPGHGIEQACLPGRRGRFWALCGPGAGKAE